MCHAFLLAGRRCVPALAVLGLLAAAIAHAAANEPIITVQVASGRHFTGTVDARTDPARLWLQVAENSIVLLRPIDWDRVTSARVNGKSLSAAELQSAIANLKPVGPPADTTRQTPSHEQSGASPTTATDIEPDARLGAPQVPVAVPDPVRAIQIEANLGHWTAGTESSGILVTLLPIDGQGNLVAAEGTLEVELIGQRFTVVTEGNGFPCLGRWVAAVHSADFGPSGAVYQFPFQAVHPDLTFDLDPHGLVHARLSVPGQGVFEASQAMVRVRPYSSVRDHAQQTTGSRFLPIERLDSRQQ
jgi:hypothetical protein